MNRHALVFFDVENNVITLKKKRKITSVLRFTLTDFCLYGKIVSKNVSHSAGLLLMIASVELFPQIQNNMTLKLCKFDFKKVSFFWRVYIMFLGST